MLLLEQKLSIPQVAYIFATIKHETANSYAPIKEKGSTKYFIKHYWDNIKVRKMLGNITQSDAYKYCGRGYVQLTGRKNYIFYTKYLSKDFLTYPQEVMEKDISFYIIVHGFIYGTFTGRRLDDYINYTKTNYLDARKIINGMDNAHKIEKYAKSFEIILNKSLEKKPKNISWLNYTFTCILRFFRVKKDKFS